ncbi:MAG: hypothetical protein WD989_02685 [Candidatus Paceibacterota bacterium]
MSQEKSWPKDYSDEEIRDIIAEGNSAKANGMASWKEAGIVELGLRQKVSWKKSDSRMFKLSIAILVVSILGLAVSIILNL